MRKSLVLLVTILIAGGCGQRDSSLLGTDTGPSSANDPIRELGGDPKVINDDLIPDPGRPSGPGGNGLSGAIVRGQVVVDLAAGVDEETFHATWGTKRLRQIEGSQFVLMELPEEGNEAGTASQMFGSGSCDTAQPNFVAESPEANQDTIAFLEGGAVLFDVFDQDALERIGAHDAFSVSLGEGIIVAVIDTGVDDSHPSLSSQMLPGYDFVDEDNDPMDEAPGLDFDEDGLVDEGAGHGTHVAGIVRTMAPYAQILPIRVLNSEGLGTATNVARGVRYAIEQGAHVINLSLGMDQKADVLRDATQAAEAAGIVIVASAGNSGRDVNHYPAKFSEVIGVGSTDAWDKPSEFSNYGSNVELAAPGEGILSTFLNHEFAIWSGTSMAAPMVAGAAALYLQLHPGTHPEVVEDALEDTAAPISGPNADELGDGRLDVWALLNH